MELENEISLQLKTAVELQIPKKFLNEKNENIIPDIIALIDAGKSLTELYQIFTNLFPEDLAILYAKRETLTLKQILKNINDFYALLQISPILDVNELRLLITEWDEKYIRLLEKDRDDYERILIIQEELSQYKPLQRSPIIVESTIIFSEMKFKNQNFQNRSNDIPVISDGYEIFDLSRPNKMLPYIKWKTNLIDIEHEELIKIYKGETEEELPDFSKILPASNIKETINTFYFTVWKGKNTLDTYTKESFMKASYNLETNLLKLKVPIEDTRNLQKEDDKYVILKRITDVLPLEPRNIFEKSIAGEMFIYDVNVNLLALSHMLYNDELFRNYLFVKEMGMTSVFSTKNTIKMFFRSVRSFLNSEVDEPSSSVSFYIHQLVAKGGEIVEVIREKKEKIKLETGFPYLQIKITAAESLEVAESFVNIFTRLLNRYKEEYPKIEKLYLSYIPEFLEYKTVEISRKGIRDMETKIARLKQAAPDLFIADYARKCLRQFQPIVIADNEVEEWKQKKFIYRGEERERQIMKFPPNNPRWNFVCPDDRYPFPGVKINKLPNKTLYPGLPCCFVDNQIGYANSNYTKLYGKKITTIRDTDNEEEIDEYTEEDVGIEEMLEGRSQIEEDDEEEEEATLKESSGTSQNQLKESSGTSQNQLKESSGTSQGEITSEIKKEKRKQETAEDLQRIRTDKIVQSGKYGSVPNSISELLKDEVNDLRRRGVPRSPNSLLHCISVAVQDKNYFSAKDKEKYISQLRQTIALSTEPGLLKQELYDISLAEISNRLKSNDFLDPNLFYRAIEEAYKINIFIFAPSLDENKRLRNKEESSGALILPKHKIFSARTPRPDRASICIYRTMGSESDVLNYPQCELLVGTRKDKEMTIFTRSGTDTLLRALVNIYKTISWDLITFSNNKIDVIGRENLYSRIDYFTLTRKLATEQYIDEYGKMRGLYLPNNLMIIFPPSQPENLQVNNQIIRGRYEDAISLFGSPVAMSLRENFVNGLWYSILDLFYGIYIPIQEVSRDVFENLLIGPSNPLGESGFGDNTKEEKVERIIKLKRDLDFILQVLKWLLLISKINVKEFLDRYVIVLRTEIVDSARIYDFKNIGRKFPIVQNVEEGIIEMQKRIPSLFLGSKIYIYSEKMLEGLRYLLEMYMKEYVKTYTPIPVTIKRKYLMQQDFLHYPDIVLFFNERDMRTWLENLKRNYEIVFSVTVNNAILSEPYIYTAPDKHIYLIQNVMEGNFLRALNIGYYWDKYHVNPGFRSPEYDENIEDLRYVIYIISPANTIIAAENHAGDSLEFISILKYNEFAHACMIRLL